MPTSSVFHSGVTPCASDGLAQDALGLRLRDEQHERVTALDMTEVETEHALAATVDASELPFVAEPEHLVGQTALLEEFERARLDADGSRRRGRRFTLVDEAYGSLPCATIPAQP